MPNSEFIKLFPKPKIDWNIALWEKKREGYLAALKTAITRPNYVDTNSDIAKWIAQEIADVEAESQAVE